MIETIKTQRSEIQQEISHEEEEKRQIEHQMAMLNERLSEIHQSLQKKYTTRNEYDRTIQETEGAFVKILESS
jgi:sjoegren syndrome nuclear autoantigen 1